jgi:hypothetical protein
MRTAQTLNETQLHLLQMFSFTRSKQRANELKNVLLDYCRKKVDAEAEKFSAENNIDANFYNSILSSHLRTPYK